jgi:predicted N-acetyltransferase YhbS
VVGYFSLANGAAAHAMTSAKVRQNMPDPIPASILARLAVDKTEQGTGLGGELLQEALKRALAGARYSASNLVIVHALHEKAAAFYAKHGFRPLRADSPLVLYLPMGSVAATL